MSRFFPVEMTIVSSLALLLAVELANAAVVVVILKTAGQASLSLTDPALTLASDAVFSQRVVGPIQLFRQQVSVNH